MRSHQLTVGRSFGVVFDHGEDFYSTLAEFCRSHDVRRLRNPDLYDVPLLHFGVDAAMEGM
jgi:hypothetical protein